MISRESNRIQLTNRTARKQARGRARVRARIGFLCVYLFQLFHVGCKSAAEPRVTLESWRGERQPITVVTTTLTNSSCAVAP